MALSEQQRARVLDLLGFCEEPWAACLADNIEDAAFGFVKLMMKKLKFKHFGDI